MLEQKNVTVKAGSSFQTICPFPVGYIYQSYNSTSPANIYGGSWTPITGRFLYCNSGTGVGGSNNVTLSLNHTHTQMDKYMPLLNYNNGTGYSYVSGSDVLTDWIATGESSWRDQGGVRVGKKIPLDTKTFSIMPTYQTCYAWRRTA